MFIIKVHRNESMKIDFLKFKTSSNLETFNQALKKYIKISKHF